MKKISLLAIAVALLSAPSLFAEHNTGTKFPYNVNHNPDIDKSEYSVYFPNPSLCADNSTREQTTYRPASQFPDPKLMAHLKEEGAKYDWGVALAGGGSKAAAFNMGILAGLSQNTSDKKYSPTNYVTGRNDKYSAKNSLLANIDVVSSVSGGSYAAFYYFSRLLNFENSTNYSSEINNREKAIDYLFSDDFPSVYYNNKSARNPNPRNNMFFKRYYETKLSDDPNERPSFESYYGDPIFSLTPTHASLTGGFDKTLWNQKYIRMHQDVLQPLSYNSRTAAGFAESVGTGVDLVGLALVSLVTSPMHLFSSWVFDRPEEYSSPSRLAYQAGIADTYGLIPNNNYSYCYDNSAFLLEYDKKPCPTHVTSKLPTNFFTNSSIDQYTNVLFPKREPLTFENLDKLYTKYLPERQKQRTIYNNVPFWVINATSPSTRNLGSLIDFDKPKPGCNVFEFTSKGFGSGQFGYVNMAFNDNISTSGNENKSDQSTTSQSEEKKGDQNSKNEGIKYDIITAVGASAAFFDANEMAVKSTAPRALAKSFIDILNANWGIDIANYNIANWKQSVHQFLPFPFYLLEDVITTKAFDPNTPPNPNAYSEKTPYIRLIDGGNAENLGAYSLIRRGVKNIIISDASFDGQGWMDDICNLRDKINSDHNLYLIMPGLGSLNTVCDAGKQHDLIAGEYLPFHYPIHQWKHPVLVGCIANKNDETCQEPLNKLFLIKPALSDKIFNDHNKNPSDDSPKEAIGYVNLKKIATETWLKPGKCSTFPQNSTVTMTLNSDSLTYGAYKDLAGFYARQIPWGGDLEGKFKKMLDEQTKDKMYPISGTIEDEPCNPEFYANTDNIIDHDSLVRQPLK